MKVYMLECAVNRYEGYATKRLREIDIEKIPKDVLADIAMDMKVPERLRQAAGEDVDNPWLMAWVRERIKKEVVKNGWVSFMTEEGGFFFIRSGNISFPASQVARMVQAWGQNITGGE